MIIRVADYVAGRLAEAGVRHVFMITGGGAMHLNDAFGRREDIIKVFNHHEQASAIAAESYCRLSGRPAAVNVTTGPGGINALNGVYGAYVDSIAMIVISGQVKRETIAGDCSPALRQLGDQEVDIVSMARPVVKYATVLKDPLKARSVMDKAIFLATSGRPGPVWVDVPVDIQAALIETEALTGFDCSDPALLQDPDLTPNTLVDFKRADAPALDAAADEIIRRLGSAKRPAIFAGAGIRIAGVRKEFLELCAGLGIPVVTGWNAHDVVPDDHPFYAGRPGTVGDRAGNFCVQNADFLLILGSRLNIRQVSYNWDSFGKRAWKAHVDVDSEELQKPTLKTDLPVHADLRDFLPKLLQKLKGWKRPGPHAGFLEWCLERRRRYPAVLPAYACSTTINPYCFMENLFRELNGDDVVVTGNGSACVVSFQAAALKEGQRLYTNSGCASMGYDLPAAIGAYYGGNGGRVICIAGDGSLMMNLQELQTVAGLGLPIKIFLLNNQGYHSIRQTQEAYFPDNEVGVGPESGVTLPDYVRVAEAFGIMARRASSMGELSPALKEILDSPGPALLEVMLDISQQFAPKLASRRLPDGTMVSPSLEDMSPFLSREEMAENTIPED